MPNNFSENSVELFGIQITPSKVLFFTGILGLLVIGTFLFTPQRFIVPNLMLMAFASVLCGSFIGFLFGFPKSNRKRNSTNDVFFEINTNLEEITDWLTKILVGIGLSQLYIAKDHIISLLNFLSKDIGNVSKSTILFVLVYFIIYGFYFGYISSSLHLKSLLDNKYNNAENFINDIEKELVKYYGTGKAFVDSSLSRINGNFSFDKLKVLKMLNHLERKGTEIASDTYRNIGIEFFKLHDYSTALELFLKSASIDNNAAALSNIAVIYSKYMDQPKLGEKYLKLALREYPTSGLINYNYACLLLRKGKIDKSLNYLEKSINLEQDVYLEIAQNDNTWKVIKDNPKFISLVPEFDSED